MTPGLRARTTIDPAKLAILISNHAEMDPSGCLSERIQTANPEAVSASPKGIEALKAPLGRLFDQCRALGAQVGERISFGVPVRV